MLTPDQEKEYNDLKEEVKDYSRYINWHNTVDKYGGFIALLFLPFLVLVYFFPNTSIGEYYLVSFLSAALIIVIIDNIFEYLSRRNSPPADRLILFFVYSAIINIDNYFNPKKAHISRRKKEFRKKAASNGFAFLSLVKNKWVVGKFGLAEAVFGKTLTEFKELLSKRLIPTIKEGDADTLLKKANDILWQFSVFLSRPSIDSLKRINDNMSTNLSEVTDNKGKNIAGFSNFLKSHVLLTHILSMLGILGSAFLVYFTGINFLGISPDSAYNTSMQFFAVLFVGYLTITITIIIKRKDK